MSELEQMPTPAQTSTLAEGPSMMMAVGVSTAISVALSAVVTYYLVTTHIETAMSEQTQIAIGGYEGIARALPLGASDEQLRSAVEDMDRNIEKLARAGMIVIDDRVVLGAPDSFYIPVKQMTSPPTRPQQPMPQVEEPRSPLEVERASLPVNTDPLKPKVALGVNGLFEEQ